MLSFVLKKNFEQHLFILR